jgi:transposase
MASQRDKRLQVDALLRAGLEPKAISGQLGVSVATVYNIKKRQDEGQDMERASGSGRKPSLDPDELKEQIKANPLTSMRSQAADLGVSEATVRRTVKKVGGKSLMRVERPLLTPQIKLVHLQRCQGLLNNLKSAKANRVIIFLDKKTWTVDPVRNRCNNRFLAFDQQVDESVRTLTTTKHPASMMSLGFVASNGEACPLIWFETGYRLTGADYVKKLRHNFLPWVRRICPNGNYVLQQDGALAHTCNVAQKFLTNNVSFWPKTMWPSVQPRRQSAGLCLLAARGGQGMQGSPPEHRSPEGLCQYALGGHGGGLHCQDLPGFQKEVGEDRGCRGRIH